MDDVNHTQCPPGSHTFDAGDPHYEGRVDEHGNQRCNDDSQPMFYCTRDEGYHHVGADAEPCFLIQEQGWAIPAPQAGEHCYEPEGGVHRCIFHPDSDDCPPLDLPVIVAAANGWVPPQEWEE